MLEINSEIGQPHSEPMPTPGKSASTAGDASWVLGPDSHVTDGVQIQRGPVAKGTHTYLEEPFLRLSFQDGPAVKTKNERRGKVRTRVFVMGDLSISPPGLSCGVWTINRSTHRLNIGIEPQLISEVAENAGSDPRTVEFDEHFGSQDPDFYHVARRLLGEQQTSGLGGRLYTDALVTELVIHLLRKYSSGGIREDSTRDSFARARLAPALEMIHDDLRTNFSLKELARVVNLSPYHFSRAFKRVIGLPPHQYVLTRRVQLAKQLLTETTLSVSEVAYQLGFYDQSHFTYHFKRLIGVTPSAVRNSNR
jgi:AraC family transcriptional regulator